ncbi:PTS transporter subunit EIIB [Schaalia sp. ZJ1691]|nr:PTS transporter subunit EIIB [Schaalia sp. ZJ1691]
MIALGGPRNIKDVEPCAMRVRVEVIDQRLVDETRLRIPEVLAVVRSGSVVQIIAGTHSDSLAEGLILRLKNRVAV